MKYLRVCSLFIIILLDTLVPIYLIINIIISYFLKDITNNNTSDENNGSNKFKEIK